MTLENNYTKLCYIEDINKSQKYLIKRQLSVEEFDFLYDSNLDQLEQILIDFERTIYLVDRTIKEGQ
jgi:hypothetical protein